MPWVEFPFSGGQHEEVEARLLPNGVLSSVKNLRHARDGRWVKRERYEGIVLTSEHTGSAAVIPTNETLSLSATAEDRLILAGAPARLYNYLPNRERVAPFDEDESGEVWAPPTFSAPLRTIVESNPPDQGGFEADAATTKDITVVACLDNGGSLVAHVYDAETGVFQHSQTLQTVDLGNNDEIKHVQCVSLRDNIIVAWVLDIAEGAATFQFDICSVGAGAGMRSFTGTPIDIGTLADPASMPCAQAVGDAGVSAHVAFAWHSGASTLTIERRASPYTSVTSTTTRTTSGSSPIHVNVYANAADNASWIVWVDVTTSLLIGAAGAGNFTSLSQATLSSDDVIIGQPTITKNTATRAIVAWDIRETESNNTGLRATYVTTTPSISSYNTYWGWRLVSNLKQTPYSTDDDAFVVATPVRKLGALTSYYLLRIDPGVVSSLASGNILHARFAEYQANYSSIIRPHLSDDDYGRWVFGWKFAPADIGRAAALWRFDYQGYQRGQAAELGGGLYFSGGLVWRWDGAGPRSAGFPEAPDIISVTAGTVGSLTPSSTYSWTVVLEREEHDGSLTLSAPAAPVSLALGAGEDSAELAMRLDKTFGRATRARIYRTQANGSVFNYVATYSAPRGGWLDPEDQEYTDTASDASIQSNHILYTQIGDVLQNDPPPGARFIFRASDRVWLAGLEADTRVRCSKNLFEGEAAAFPAVDAFAVTLPERVIGGGTLDSTAVFFTEHTIAAIVGPGPDDSGIGTFELREIPADAGLVPWGHRSIVEARPGLFYQAPDGIYLLPRGFGHPEFIGAPVRTTLESYPYITSAVVVPKRQEVRFTAVDSLDAPTGGVMLVYDLRSESWIVSDVDDANTPYVASAIWGGDTHVIAEPALASTQVLEEQDTPAITPYFPSEIITGDVRPGAVARYGRCREIALLFEWRGNCSVVADLSLDGGLTYPYQKTWEDLSSLTVGQTIELLWHLPVQKATRFRLRISDTGTTGAGVIYLGVSLDMRQKSNGARLPAARR